MSRSCINCAAPINTLRAHAKFCSPACRVSHCRSKALPRELTSVPRWVRHDARKRPLGASDGRMVDCTRPAAWATFQEAKESPHGVGLGFVLSVEDDIACIDIDGCVTGGVVSASALDIARATSGVFMIEYSISGKGVHVWHHSGNEPGTNRVENGVRVERYSHSRFIAVTGKRISL